MPTTIKVTATENSPQRTEMGEPQDAIYVAEVTARLMGRMGRKENRG